MILSRKEQRMLHAACIKKHLKALCFEARGFWRACRPDGLAMTALALLVASLIALGILVSTAFPAPAIVLEKTKLSVNLSGASMLPACPYIWWAEMEFVPFSALKEGDIVLYWNRRINQHVSHRLKGKYLLNRKAWIAKGDNNAFYDGDAVTAENFICRIKKP
jgi:hypothetical protein